MGDNQFEGMEDEMVTLTELTADIKKEWKEKSTR